MKKLLIFLFLSYLLFPFKNTNNNVKLVFAKTKIDPKSNYIDYQRQSLIDKFLDKFENISKIFLNNYYKNYKIKNNISSYLKYKKSDNELQDFDFEKLKNFNFSFIMPPPKYNDDFKNKKEVEIENDAPFLVVYSKLIHFDVNGKLPKKDDKSEDKKTIQEKNIKKSNLKDSKNDILNFVIKFYLKDYSNDNIYDIGNIKVLGKKADLEKQYKNEFFLKFLSIAKYLKIQDIIYQKQGRKVYILDDKKNKIESVYKIFENGKYITYMIIKEKYENFDVGFLERKYKSVSPLNKIKKIKRSFVDLDVLENIYIGFTGGLNLYFSTSVFLSLRLNMKNLRPMLGYELIYSYKNYSPFSNVFAGLKYNLILRQGFRLNFYSTFGFLLAKNELSHLSFSIMTNAEYMITDYFSLYFGLGISYFFFIKKDYKGGSDNRGAVPITFGMSFKV